MLAFMHHKYVPQPQVHHSPDDARQRPQDAKDLHGLYQVILRRDSRRNRRHVQEREWYVVILISDWELYHKRFCYFILVVISSISNIGRSAICKNGLPKRWRQAYTSGEVNSCLTDDIPIVDTAKIIGKGKLLILFVCHSGSITRPEYDNAMHTLIKRYIRLGYSSIIAPMWSLNTEILPLWLTTFMGEVWNGRFVIDAPHLHVHMQYLFQHQAD